MFRSSVDLWSICTMLYRGSYAIVKDNSLDCHLQNLSTRLSYLCSFHWVGLCTLLPKLHVIISVFSVCVHVLGILQWYEACLLAFSSVKQLKFYPCPVTQSRLEKWNQDTDQRCCSTYISSLAGSFGHFILENVVISVVKPVLWIYSVHLKGFHLPRLAFHIVPIRGYIYIKLC